MLGWGLCTGRLYISKDPFHTFPLFDLYTTLGSTKHHISGAFHFGVLFYDLGMYTEMYILGPTSDLLRKNLWGSEPSYLFHLKQKDKLLLKSDIQIAGTAYLGMR